MPKKCLKMFANVKKIKNNLKYLKMFEKVGNGERSVF